MWHVESQLSIRLQSPVPENIQGGGLRGRRAQEPALQERKWFADSLWAS